MINPKELRIGNYFNPVYIGGNINLRWPFRTFDRGSWKTIWITEDEASTLVKNTKERSKKWWQIW